MATTDTSAHADQLGDTSAELRGLLRELSPLPRLAAVREELSLLDSLTRRAVEQARDAGETWEAIGTALGVSKQAAHERYGR